MLKEAAHPLSAAAPSAQAEPSCCRFCNTPLEHVFLDLGLSPLANSYLRDERAKADERFFPLRAYVCGECFLVQLEEWEAPENIFGDYAYFSSYSESWLQHVKSYVARVIDRFGIGPNSKVVEIASNDGYLLQYLVEAEVPVLGIEPAQNVAAVARAKGIPTRVEFFGERTARTLRREGLRASLLIGNNVLAHVPDLNDFVKGMSILLDDQGVITMEFPHLMRLFDECQIDTIYHEHFSYFSLVSAEKIFAAHGLTLFDLEEIPTHGGSLRIYAQHSNKGWHPISHRVHDLRAREIGAGYANLDHYNAFEERALEIKRKLLAFLEEAKRQGKRVVGYGAPAKGNTLLNYCGITTDLIEYTVDRNPHKQGCLLPGSHIPIFEPERINVTKPDYILILPWNLKREIVNQLSFARGWGAQFVVPIPEPRLVE
ncbi:MULTISPECIES: class I SAM-dependent methyltransferase [unclassified Bradyrhizobium]|uniref:class I SAM-dependent methyltransferase n=1 Tax=unclassified Bradyrhizobium TaxID=2631580 RepID=UPI00247A5CC7|nr:MULTISPECIES: class I SAM-dependent methyltransferase [unclassified Bradyrhizobium]WGR69671.1 class I SAM-dependent methyltransferase [Bradyrhizobium sp. ISRA426]WGR81728.1 class I SAM-dependent methyltransferase [Bradyrhizobium sp. ISRA430]WGR84913.1 class I SAM-dependent methyltransferase [Bradyrhizobium sp. ISRA432]